MNADIALQRHRIGRQIRRRRLVLDDAVLDQRNTVADPQCRLHLLFDQQDGDALRPQGGDGEDR